MEGLVWAGVADGWEGDGVILLEPTKSCRLFWGSCLKNIPSISGEEEKKIPVNLRTQ